MYFLSFETSTKIFSLALSRDEKVLRFRNLRADSVLEDCILPAMDKLLDAAKIKFNQIDAFAIALGPGSFTSLRVGLSTVKSFAMSTSKPLVGIPSLDIIAKGIALSSPKKYDEICVLNDARREKVYACLYGPDGRKSEYLLTSLADVLDRVHGKTLFVGDGLGLYQKKIQEAYRLHKSSKNSPCQCFFAEEKYGHPQAKVMADLVYERLKAKAYDDPAAILPLYLYPQDCQVSRN